MIKTQFASADRSSETVIWSQYGIFLENSILNEFLGKVDQYIIVLNNNRQIIYGNASLLNDFGIQSVDDILGKKPGEVFDCKYAWCVAGCGTSNFCKDCGAVNSVLESQQKNSDAYQECVILTKSGKTFELGVSSKQINISGGQFTIVCIRDISAEKKSKSVEEIFLHDLSNLATGIKSMLQLMTDDRITDKKKIEHQLMKTADCMVDELASYKMLASAEDNVLDTVNRPENSISLIERAVNFVENIPAAKGNILYIHHTTCDHEIVTDKNLINRVLVNMLTNAVEASTFGEKVTVGFDVIGDEGIFWVHNNKYMPEDIQSKIFRKAFSTKRNGAGMGTHSIRILTEKYLNGRVDFESEKKYGTTFKVFLPL